MRSSARGKIVDLKVSIRSKRIVFQSASRSQGSSKNQPSLPKFKILPQKTLPTRFSGLRSFDTEVSSQFVIKTGALVKNEPINKISKRINNANLNLQIEIKKSDKKLILPKAPLPCS